MVSPWEYLRLTLDPVRLAILGAAAIGPVDVAGLAEQLSLPERRVLEGIGTLRAAGLLSDDLELDRDALATTARALPSGPVADDVITEGPWSSAEAEVLARFFERERLAEIPASASKRRIVLERLAQEFEPGVRYPERTVDRMLQVFHPDYAALRRYLVDEGFMTRAEGVYWRTGGRFDT